MYTHLFCARPTHCNAHDVCVVTAIVQIENDDRKEHTAGDGEQTRREEHTCACAHGAHARIPNSGTASLVGGVMFDTMFKKKQIDRSTVISAKVWMCVCVCTRATNAE